MPGIAVAGAAEMTPIGFTGGAHCRPGHDSRLYAGGATLVIGSMAQLPSAPMRLNQRAEA